MPDHDRARARPRATLHRPPEIQPSPLRPRPAVRRRPFRSARLLASLFVAVLALSGCNVAAPPPAAGASDCSAAVVGDSLTVGVVPYMSRALAEQGCTLAWIDGKGSRRTFEGVQIIAERARAKQIPSVLVVGLGTNDRYHMDDFAGHVDTVMRHAAGRKVIWIDVAHTPVKARLNSVLVQKARQHPNLSIMRWDQPYWSHSEWRATDQIHATPAGYLARAEMIAGLAKAVVK